jgi:alkanesulfonate monooxygenase SsuD/methylene tetrahydromethanopterin reductase-like flavin-dependent oxidoreductase (luciferase family)
LIEVPLSVLDLAPVRAGATATDALREAVDLAQHTERLGYLRYWFAEHHGMASIASSSPEILIEHIASTSAAALARGNRVEPGRRAGAGAQ